MIRITAEPPHPRDEQKRHGAAWMDEETAKAKGLDDSSLLSSPPSEPVTAD